MTDEFRPDQWRTDATPRENAAVEFITTRGTHFVGTYYKRKFHPARFGDPIGVSGTLCWRPLNKHIPADSLHYMTTVLANEGVDPKLAETVARLAFSTVRNAGRR